MHPFLQKKLAAYDDDHRHPINQAIHKVAIPLIEFSVLGLLWPITVYGPLNAAMLLCCALLFFYCYLSIVLAAGMLLKIFLYTGIYHYLTTQEAFPLTSFSVLVFVVAWAAQFVGHKIEGRRPSFLSDLVYLAIGPLWSVRQYYASLGFTKL